jgi:hypothetical protein
MFRLIYTTLRNFYNKIAKAYVSFLLKNGTKILLVYLLFIIITSIGAFTKLKFLEESKLESYTMVKEDKSEAYREAVKLNKMYPVDSHNNFFAHRITDLGHYVEIIVTASNNNKERKSDSDLLQPEYNLINKKLIEKYNEIHDWIAQRIQISNPTNKSQVFTYSTGLCAQRLGKCAIEGGLIRTNGFQNTFLNSEIFYSIDDPKQLYIDMTAFDGASLTFLLGQKNFRKDKCNDEGLCYVKHAPIIRNRFDLLSTTDEEKERAYLFMNEFVKFMETVDNSLLNVSYFTSHTAQAEITKYSTIDVKYVAISFLFFWSFYAFVICFDLTKWLKRIKLYILSVQWANSRQNSSLCIDGGALLVGILILQIFLTIFATIGLLSYFNVILTQFLTVAVFAIFCK